MQVSAIGACVCETGYVLSGTQCLSCPKNEKVQGSACVCEAGYVRASEGEPCEPPPTSGPGAPCSASAACEDADFAYCAEASNGDRYCTSEGCQTSADCPEGYACADGAGGRYCQRSPLGQGVSCEADADCASYEATFCEPLLSHTCLVQGCEVGGSGCFEGWQCCDVSAYGMPIPICVPEGNCP